jgi:hypothetical protein
VRRVHPGVEHVLEHEQLARVGLHAEVALPLPVHPDAGALEQRADEIPEFAPVQLDRHAAGGRALGGRQIGAHVPRSADESIADDIAPAEANRLAHDARRGIEPERLAGKAGEVDHQHVTGGIHGRRQIVARPERQPAVASRATRAQGLEQWRNGVQDPVQPAFRGPCGVAAAIHQVFHARE